MKSKAPRLHRRHSNAKVDPTTAAKMHLEGKSIRAVARELGVSRMAVARAISFADEQALGPSNTKQVNDSPDH
jgi:transposase